MWLPAARAPFHRSHNSCFERHQRSFCPPSQDFVHLRICSFRDKNDINYTQDLRLDPTLFSITLLLFKKSFVRTFVLSDPYSELMSHLDLGEVESTYQ